MSQTNALDAPTAPSSAAAQKTAGAAEAGGAAGSATGAAAGGAQSSVLVRRYLRLFPTMSPRILCIGPDSGNARLQADIRAFRPQAEISVVDAADARAAFKACQALDDTPFDICLISAETIAGVKAVHRIAIPIKRREIAVVSVYARRPFLNAKPAPGSRGSRLEMFAQSKLVAPAGDYLEFGVFDGNTMTLARQVFAEGRVDRLFGFDTFAGISGALEAEASFNDGDFYSNQATAELNMRLVESDKARFWKGDICELPGIGDAVRAEYGLRVASVVHIDVDVYRPAKAALQFVTPLLRQGSILLFDEFSVQHADNNLGERRALREWLEETPQFEVERWRDYGGLCRSFIVHKV